MRIKKPQPFDPDRQYSPGKRAVYRGMVIIAERWVKPSDKLIEKVGKWIAYALIIFGLLSLWVYSREKKEIRTEQTSPTTNHN